MATNADPLVNQSNLEAGTAYQVDPMTDKYEVRIRNQFVRKVLSICSCQLMITTAVATFGLSNEQFGSFLMNPITFIGSIIGVFASMIPLFFGMAKKYPTNYILLTIFTLCESVGVGAMCIQATARTGSMAVIIQALVVTTAVVAGLTIYAMQTKRDFSDGLSYALVIGIGLMVASLLNMFLRSRMVDSIVAGALAMLFGFYLIYDLQRLLSDEIDIDDYILGAMMLYVDVIGIFMQILRLLTNSQSDN